jgi:tetratricopeptide (TPR) repeat protein
MKYIFSTYIVLMALLSGCSSSGEDNKEQSVTGYPEIDKASIAVQQSPTDPEAYYRRAEAYNLYEGYDQAIRDLQKAINLDSNYVDAYHLLADTYLDYYNSRMALNTIHEAAARFPDRIPTLLKLTEFQYILKMNDGAKGTISNILSKDPLNGDAWFWQGMIARDEEKTADAIRYFQKATELDAYLIDAWIECGKLLSKEKKPLAIRYFQNAVQLDSINTSAWHAFAEYYQNQEQYQEALATYKRLILINPDYHDAYFNSGLIYMEMDSLANARKQFDMTIKVEPTMAMAYFARGNTFELEGDIPSAQKDYEQALALDPSLERAQDAIKRLAQ